MAAGWSKKIGIPGIFRRVETSNVCETGGEGHNRRTGEFEVVV
jgi:hypothetical protein